MTTPMAHDSAMHGAAFLTNIEQVLLRTLQPGDNAVRDSIEETGAVLRLPPPFSFGYCSIELAFSKLEALLKNTAARTDDDLFDAIAGGIDTFTPSTAATLRRSNWL